MPRLGDLEGGILAIILEGVSVGLVDYSSPCIPKQLSKKQGGKVYPYSLNRSVNGLIDKNLLRQEKTKSGHCRLVLTKEGKKLAKGFSIASGSIKFKKPKKWDKKWRVVIFDIPETNRKFRSILRRHLYALEFYKIQKSVFVSPHPYEKSILELVSFYSAEPYVRVMTVERIDNEANLRKYFFQKKVRLH